MVAFAKNSNYSHWLDLCRIRFAQMLPQIQQEANAALHAVPPDQREALIEEVVQRAFGTLLRLAERGKMQIAYPKPLAMVAVKQLGSPRRRQRLG